MRHLLPNVHRVCGGKIDLVFDMHSYRFIRRKVYNKNNGRFFSNIELPSFVKLIFAVCRILGLFPYRLDVSLNSVIICRYGLIASYGYLAAVFGNIVYLVKNFEHECRERHYFFMARLFLTHAILLVYIGTAIFRCKWFKNSVNSFLIISTAWPSKVTDKSNGDINVMRRLYIFFVFNCLWTIAFVVYFIRKGDHSITTHFLHGEDIIIILVETQICSVLSFIYVILRQLERKTKHAVQLHQVRSKANNFFYYDEFSVFHITEGNNAECSFEDLRLMHLQIFNIMDVVNDYFGVANLVFILAARFTFAFYLYSSFSQSFKWYDFLVSNFNLQRIFFICYCFQVVKNQETKLKTTVNDTDTHNLDEKSLSQFELYNNQIHILEVKFDAYGLFPLDFTTVLSILTTTAGYLVILSQMNV